MLERISVEPDVGDSVGVERAETSLASPPLPMADVSRLGAQN